MLKLPLQGPRSLSSSGPGSLRPQTCIGFTMRSPWKTCRRSKLTRGERQSAALKSICSPGAHLGDVAQVEGVVRARGSWQELITAPLLREREASTAFCSSTRELKTRQTNGAARVLVVHFDRALDGGIGQALNLTSAKRICF